MNDQFLKVAKQAARDAGKVLLKYYGKKQQFREKTDSADLVAQADLRSEEIILKALTKNFPDHNILSEEKGDLNKQSEFIWVIDPLDGTTSFLAGMPNFAICISLLKQNKPVLGVINYVFQKELFWAEKNRGAFVNGRKISVNKVPKLNQSAFAFEYGKIQYRKIKDKTFFQPLLHKIRSPFILGSSGVDLALLSKGVVSGFATQGNPWDFAGGAIIVEEAGGKVTDLEGQPIDWTRKRIDIVASNGFIHDQILEALKQ